MHINDDAQPFYDYTSQMTSPGPPRFLFESPRNDGGHERRRGVDSPLVNDSGVVVQSRSLRTV